MGIYTNEAIITETNDDAIWAEFAALQAKSQAQAAVNSNKDTNTMIDLPKWSVAP